MPHVNLLFPFLKGFEKEQTVAGMRSSAVVNDLQAACAKLGPFKIRFARVGKFDQKDSATLHLVPEFVPIMDGSSSGSFGSFRDLIEAVEAAVEKHAKDVVADQPRKGAKGTDEYFHPHLTLGQCPLAQAETKMQQFAGRIFGSADATSDAFVPVEFVVDRLHVVGRVESGVRMEVRESIGLGTGKLLGTPDTKSTEGVSKCANVTVAELMTRVREWAFRGIDGGENGNATAFAPPPRGAPLPASSSTSAFVDCAGKILVPPGKYIPFAELAPYIESQVFRPQLLDGFQPCIEKTLSELTAAFHEQNRINDIAAGLSEVSDESAAAALQQKRDHELLLKKHAAFEVELAKRLETGVAAGLKTILAHLEWVATEAQLLSCRKSLTDAWHNGMVPKILSLHATLVLGDFAGRLAAPGGGAGALSTPQVSVASSSPATSHAEPASIQTVTSSPDSAAPAADALAFAWKNNDLSAIRSAKQLKNMAAKIKRRCDYLARFLDLSSKRKPNATYSMIVDLAARNKRGARAQQKADTTKTNLSTLHNMTKDDFIAFYSDPDVCQTILHAVIDTVDTHAFENQVLAICGPDQDFLRVKPDVRLLEAVEARMNERESRRQEGKSSKSSGVLSLRSVGDDGEGAGEVNDAGMLGGSGGSISQGVAAVTSGHMVVTASKTPSPTATISPAICDVNNRMLTFEADLYSDIALFPQATEGIEVNAQVAGGEAATKTTLCYRPMQNSAPMVPIPIFARYALREAGEAEEVFLEKNSYIPWDEETAKPDVQMWRMAVARVIQNSRTLQRAIATRTGGGEGLELTIRNAQWVLTKILLDLAMLMADRMKGEVTIANRFDSLPSMVRSVVLTAVGITQAGDKPLGNAWACCKNVSTRPELPEDKRDWHMLLVLARVYPKTGLDAGCFRANLRRLLLRFFNKMCEPYVQELWKEYQLRKNQYDKEVADTFFLKPVTRKELAGAMLMRPSKFCAICWRLKPPHHFPKSCSSFRRVNRFEKHSKSASTYQPPETLEKFKAEFDAKMQQPVAPRRKKSEDDNDLSGPGTKQTETVQPFGKTLLELYTCTERVTNKRGHERETNEAVRAVILSGKSNGEQGNVEPGRITKELNSPPDFDTFAARVRNEVCGTTGYTCLECMYRLKQIAKAQLNNGGHTKVPKDPNYIVPLPDPIDPLPGLAQGVVEEYNEGVAKIREQIAEKKKRFLGVCKKAFAARLEKEAGVYREYEDAAERVKAVGTQNGVGSGSEWRAPTHVVIARGGGGGDALSAGVAVTSYSGLGGVSPRELAGGSLKSNKRPRDGLDDLEVVGTSNTLLKEIFDGDRGAPDLKKKKVEEASNSASPSPKQDKQSTFAGSLAKLTNLFGGLKNEGNVDVEMGGTSLAGGEAEMKDGPQERFASVWACSLMGNETAAVAAVCAAYRGPDFDVLSALLRASGLVSEREDVTVAIQGILRELVLDFRTKEMLVRENRFLAKFYNEKYQK
eukprot:g9833.t1